MKANEAPEKIYLTTFGFPICEPIPQESSNPDTVWSTKPYLDEGSIEYTRTDAFIKKASFWLECNLSDRPIEDRKFWIEDFVNYMKIE